MKPEAIAHYLAEEANRPGLLKSLALMIFGMFTNRE